MPRKREDRSKGCSQCGQPHERCWAHNRAGNPCGLGKKPGLNVCGLHGGNTPVAKEAARKRLQRKAADDASRAFGLPVEIDPHSALLEELHRTAGAVAWLGEIVGGLNDNQITWGEKRWKTGGDDHGQTYEAGPNIWYELWMLERKHLTDVARECAKAGIEERRIRLAEDQGRLVAGVIQRILAGMLAALVSRLDDLEAARSLVESVWSDLVREIVPNELRAIAAGTEVA